MLLSLAPALSLLLPLLTVPEGYYTLKELGSELSRQGVHVQVAAACSADTYAIRVTDLSWEKLSKALMADGRIAVVRTNVGWQVERTPLSKRDDARALDRYIAYARESLDAVYGPATQKCADLEPRPAAEREAEVDRLKKAAGGDSTKEALAQLVYLYSAEHDLPYFHLAMPAYLLKPGGVGFGALVSTNLWEGRALMAPDGDLRSIPWVGGKSASDEQVKSVADVTSIGMKLTVDPVTLTTTVRFALVFTMADGNVGAGDSPTELSPMRVRIHVTSKDLWDKATLEALAARGVQTAEILSKSTAKETVPMPEKPVRLSQGLLRWAEGSHANLVSYVSSFFDPVLPPRSRSLADLVTDARAYRVDPMSQHDELKERVEKDPPSEPRSPALAMSDRVTLSDADGVIVVRNESRFLDGLAASPTCISTAAENELLHDQLPSLSTIAHAVEGMRPASWPRSSFASGNLDFCNPISFSAFASALVASPALLKQISSLDKQKTIPFDQLEPSAQKALQEEIVRCSLLNDACADTQGPLAAPALMHQVGANLQLRITPGKGSIQFEVVSGQMVIWASWVRNVGRVQ